MHLWLRLIVLFFFEKLTTFITEHTSNENRIILAGDFNCGLRDIDRKGHSKTSKLDKSITILKKLLSLYNLQDSLTAIDRSSTDFTYERDKILSRLDYIFYSKGMDGQLMAYNSRYLIANSRKCSISDHKAVIVKYKTNHNKRGPNFWKLNTSYLEDNEYITIIKNLLVRERHRLNEFGNSKILLWENIKLQIKHISIQHGKDKSKQFKSKLFRLHSERDNIDENQTQKIDQLDQEIDHLYEEKAVGARIRSRVKWYEDGEKSTKYFLRLESERQSSNAINKLRINNGNSTSNDENLILNEIISFYSDLYSEDDITEEQCINYLDAIDLPRPLTTTEKTVVKVN
jgi:hypothetical protein